MKKQIGIMKEVYDRLKAFRDEEGLPSFTEAIRKLLDSHVEITRLHCQIIDPEPYQYDAIGHDTAMEVDHEPLEVIR